MSRRWPGGRRRTDRPLTDHEKTLLSAYVPARDLDAARIHDGHVPWYLSRRFIAIVRGRHIYIRGGFYQSGTAEGLALLAHELVHVRQYREGMTVLRYLWHGLSGYWNNPYEREAFAVEERVRRDLGTTLDPATMPSSRGRSSPSGRNS